MIEIDYNEKKYPVSWPVGSDIQAIENAIRTILQLDISISFILIDKAGQRVAIGDALPNEVKLLIVPQGPKPLPIVGNAFEIVSKEGALPALHKLVKKYGRMFPLQVPGIRFYLCTDADVLQDMLQRPDTFQKLLPPANMDIGNIREHTLKDALFTAADNEEIWHVAHRILMPGFSAQAIRHYYNRMVEIGDELIDHFTNMPPKQPILITDWMTRMTFEVIGYAGFSYRFHCLNENELPPFVKAMITTFIDAKGAAQRILPKFCYYFSRKKREKADALLCETVDGIIRKRKEQMARGEDFPKDLLHLMLTGKDRVSGQQLSEENIRYQLIGFLTAGHETTSGLLAYAIYRILSNPDVEAKLIEEADRVLGRDYSYKPTFEDIEKLQYTECVLKETLRINPTAPGFYKSTMKDTVAAGKYPLKEGDLVLFLLSSLHGDSKYWGEDTEAFDPDRFLPELELKRHPHCYHPFGAGMRSCIGFQFAMIEAKMVLARLYQRFRFRLHDPKYQLKHIEMLTVKPKDLFITLEKRPEEKGRFPFKESLLEQTTEAFESHADAPLLQILYGSNLGTSQTIAQEVAQHAGSLGYKTIVRELDQQLEVGLENSYVLIITSTYNGTPPDNALQFEKLLRNLQGSQFSSCRYAILGVGNKQWYTTFQKFPRFIQQRLQELGASCYYPLGEIDVDGDCDRSKENWLSGMWQKLQEIYPPVAMGKKQALLSYVCESIDFGEPQAYKVLGKFSDFHTNEMTVVCNEELLSTGSERSTRHIEIFLPPGAVYASGDHLGVIPENPSDAVELAAELCNRELSDIVLIKSLQEVPQKKKLPIGIPISVRDLLTIYVDLLGPLTRRELRLLAHHCPCPPERKALEELMGSKFSDEILAKECSFLQICQDFRSIRCSLDLLLSARPLLKPRYYSISSSPLVNTDRFSITVGAGKQRTAEGCIRTKLCSSFLANVSVNQKIRCFFKDTKSRFRLPEERTRDLILIGPGTGIAPLRGFLQERDQQRKEGIAIGRQLLFFGCRHPNQDYLYHKELEDYLRSGLLESLFVAFSRYGDIPKRYVQDLLREQSSLIWEFVSNGACILLCGEGKHMAPAVRETLIDLFQREGSLSAEEAHVLFLQKREQNLYIEDVWA